MGDPRLAVSGKCERVVGHERAGIENLTSYDGVPKCARILKECRLSRDQERHPKGKIDSESQVEQRSWSMPGHRPRRCWLVCMLELFNRDFYHSRLTTTFCTRDGRRLDNAKHGNNRSPHP